MGWVILFIVLVALIVSYRLSRLEEEIATIKYRDYLRSKQEKEWVQSLCRVDPQEQDMSEGRELLRKEIERRPDIYSWRAKATG